MPPIDPAVLLTIAFLGVALVVLLITWVRLPAFLALAVAALFVGLAARMPLAEIPRAFQAGIGDTLGFVAMVIALGTVIGKLLAESGGAVVVSNALSRALGERRLDWALMLSGFIIGLPVFFQVGLVLLAPVLFTAQRQTRTPLLRLGLPIVAGLSAAHGLVPPHPGPIAAIERLGADPGRTLFYSLILGLPLAIICGAALRALHLQARARRTRGDRGAVHQRREARTHAGTRGHAADDAQPGAADAAGRAQRKSLMPDGAGATRRRVHRQPARGDDGRDPPRARHVRTCVRVQPRPVLAVRGGVAAADRRSPAGRRRRRRVRPCAGVAQVDTAIAQAMSGLALSPLVLGWVIASLLRLSVGSATVSVITAASIMAPIVGGMPSVNKELLVVSIGAGSLIARTSTTAASGW